VQLLILYAVLRRRRRLGLVPSLARRRDRVVAPLRSAAAPAPAVSAVSALTRLAPALLRRGRRGWVVRRRRGLIPARRTLEGWRALAAVSLLLLLVLLRRRRRGVVVLLLLGWVRVRVSVSPRNPAIRLLLLLLLLVLLRGWVVSLRGRLRRVPLLRRGWWWSPTTRRSPRRSTRRSPLLLLLLMLLLLRGRLPPLLLLLLGLLRRVLCPFLRVPLLVPPLRLVAHAPIRIGSLHESPRADFARLQVG
jgi:hypothetical protein